MLQAIREHVPFAETYEWTVESNPETVTQEKADFMKSAGVNRVSVGAQSFNEQLLKQLERWHNPDNVKKAVDIYRKSGIENINLDKIQKNPKNKAACLFNIKKVLEFLRKKQSINLR